MQRTWWNVPATPSRSDLKSSSAAGRATELCQMKRPRKYLLSNSCGSGMTVG